MPAIKRIVPDPPTHVLVRTSADASGFFWIREIWFNDPVIGAQPPDETVTDKRRYRSQRTCMRAGLTAAGHLL